MNLCHVDLASGFSGGERQALLLIEYQVSQGLVPLVVANPKSAFASQAKDLGCEVFYAANPMSGHYQLRHKHLSLVHVHDARAVYWALVHKWLSATPYIITRRIDNQLKQKYLLKSAYHQAKAVVGVSHAVKQAVQTRFPDLKVHVIPDSPVTYPVNPIEVEKIRQQFEDKFLVIQASKLLKHKGHDVTIAAARALGQQTQDIQFCILGDGPDEAEIKAQAEGLANVSFMGPQTNMGDWFQAADLLVHPSYNEGLGSVILEAMRADLVVLGTKVGGIVDIIQDKKNGLLVEPSKPDQLAQAITVLKSQPNLRQRLKAQASRSVEDFDIANCAPLYHRLYAD